MLLAIIVISSIGALLAGLLVLAERVITNYGDVEIDINQSDKKFTIRGGGSLLESLSAQKIFIPSACGGRSTCGYCKVTVLEGGGGLLPTEEPFMNKDERKNGVRLSCQVKVRNNLKIEIPEHLLSVREYICQCEKIIDYTYDIKQFNLKLIEPDSIKYKAGQYVQLLTPAYEGSSEEVYRAYSISSDPADNTRFELIVRRVASGICTTYLFDHLKENDRVRVNGSYGEFYLRDTGAPIVFIAGGSGIAPIKCILHDMVNQQNKRRAVFFFGVRGMKDLFLFDEMQEFEKKLADFKYVPVISQPEPGDNWTGATGRVTDIAAAYLEKQSDAKDHECYLCGSPGMIDSAIKTVMQYGIPLEKNYYDKFS
ncbi:oxidoreductase [candidate division WOR-3 bacterium RBG_13_43_14]|uniref:Oxidoreductase n=1 Tax=candidate division WOR-3 bacterium RBG_13_43_14 TaxID=1802590 RepID=A0A1F4UDS4_UNCW3|nr:MAG: oxidoreductase [candidate division WOR-3 bacterium RBG_13_43_14]